MEKIQMTLTVTADQAVKIAKILTVEDENRVSAQSPEQPQIQAAPIQQQSAPLSATSVQYNAQPAAAAPVQVSQAPVSAPVAYTLEQIQAACTPLMDSGKQAELLSLMAQFGIRSLPELPADQRGAFAAAIRNMGAII